MKSPEFRPLDKCKKRRGCFQVSVGRTLLVIYENQVGTQLIPPYVSTDTHHQIALTLVPGVGSILIRQLISYCGSATDVFRSPLARLMKIPGIGEVTARAILKPGVLTEAEQVMNRLEKMGATRLFYTDKAYPARLKTLYDAPPCYIFRERAI